MQLRPLYISIIGAPVAAWALYGCLVLGAVQPDVAGIAAIAWGSCWIVIARLGSGRGGVSASMRGGAILTSLFLPLPVYVLTLSAEWLGFLPVSVGLPMFAMLCSAAPLLFWSMALRPRRRRRNSQPMMVMQFNHFEPRASAGSIPPRTSTMRRIV
jgi:hypothetical protein